MFNETDYCTLYWYSFGLKWCLIVHYLWTFMNSLNFMLEKTLRKTLMVSKLSREEDYI